MPTPFSAALIRYARLQKNWSQEGLCKGICAVSYLSKVEQGKATPSPEILRALLSRLGVDWHGGAEAQQAAHLASELYEALLSQDDGALTRLSAELAENRSVFLYGPSMLDLLLLERLTGGAPPCAPVPLNAFEACFSARERALWLIGENRAPEAVSLLPVSYTYLSAGWHAYSLGQYTHAAEFLLHTCALAAEEGRARVMMHSRLLLGNCYSDLGDFAEMSRHYRIAGRLAQDLNDPSVRETIAYNQASTSIELGDYAAAYAYFQSLTEPNALCLHKLAICLEKLGRPQEALAALDRALTAQADYPEREWIDRMCQLVRYRLTHPGYLRDAAYGSMLTDCFTRMRRELPRGYAGFHLPWMEEWYTANRQYKQAYELYRDFSLQSRLLPF